METEAKRVRARLYRSGVSVPIGDIRQYLADNGWDGILTDEQMTDAIAYFTERGTGRGELTTTTANSIITQQAEKMGVVVSTTDIQELSVTLLQTLNADTVNLLDATAAAMSLISEYTARKEAIVMSQINDGFAAINQEIGESNTRITSKLLDEFTKMQVDANTVSEARTDKFFLSIDELLGQFSKS